MEFDEFVRQFRERTAQRMVEFEKALAKAQAEMEQPGKTAKKPAGTQGPQGSVPPAPGPRMAARPGSPRGAERKKPPARRRQGAGPVQGVLKKYQ